MFVRSLKLLLSPTAGDGGGSAESPGAGESDAEGTETEAETPASDDADSGETEGETPPAPAKAPKKTPVRKVQISSTKLKELEAKAAKADEHDRAQKDAADRAESEKLVKQQETDPQAALTSLKRKYTNDTKKLQQQIETLTQENTTLRKEQSGTALEREAKTVLAAALKAAKLEPLNDKAAARMVTEFGAALDVERGEDGKYEIFGKDDGSDAAEVARKLISEDFKDLYLKPRRSDPANPGDSRRREPETPKRPGWQEGYNERKKMYGSENGVVPAIGLKPKGST